MQTAIIFKLRIADPIAQSISLNFIAFQLLSAYRQASICAFWLKINNNNPELERIRWNPHLFTYFIFYLHIAHTYFDQFSVVFPHIGS